MSEYGYHRSTFWRNTKIFKNKNIFIPELGDRHLVIYLDDLRVNKKSYLIASNGKHVISFCLVDYESSNNWRNFLKNFNEPEYIVCELCCKKWAFFTRNYLQNLTSKLLLFNKISMLLNSEKPTFLQHSSYFSRKE